MKKILLSAFIILSLLSVHAQENSFITGSWKIVSIYDADLYINLETDSVSLSGEMANMYSDSAKQKNKIEEAKNIFGSTQFHFDKSGSFKQTIDTITLYTGKYKIDITNRVLELTTKNSRGEDVTESGNYELINNRLKFYFLMDETKLHFELRKIVK